LNSVNNVENLSVSIRPEKKMLVQNLIPVIRGIIIARLAWMICFFAWVVANIKQEGAAFPSWIISVRNVEPDSVVRRDE
jgi:hypothetical protein